MDHFEFYNPVRIVFGKGSIQKISQLISSKQKVMITYGGGSIKKNGVYKEVTAALRNHNWIEFGGIEANPDYETCMKAVQIAKKENVDFLLSVGGGSVLDGTKFIAAASLYEGDDPWTFVENDGPVKTALPIGCVLTLPATGSEMNGTAVLSWRARNEKRGFRDECMMPQFSILDPETTYSLPERQTANGIVDTFVHVTEQYLTYPVNAPLQDRQAEAILHTVVEEGPKVFDNPNNYEIRANLMWCATNALNHLIGRGVPQDWATHLIGHELTVLFGMDHGQSLAVVHPALLKYMKKEKAGKLMQFGKRIWGLNDLSEEDIVDQAIEKMEAFFQSVHVPTRLNDYGIKLDDAMRIVPKLEKRGLKLGERQNILAADIEGILRLTVSS